MAFDYDVLLSYQRPDRAAVERPGCQLEGKGLKVWLDVWRLQPGKRWRPVLEEQIENLHASSVERW